MRELNWEQDEKDKEALKRTIRKTRKGDGDLSHQGQRHPRAGNQGRPTQDSDSAGPFGWHPGTSPFHSPSQEIRVTGIYIHARKCNHWEIPLYFFSLSLKGLTKLE